MSDFLKGIVEFKATSEVEAYDRKVSKWLEEAKEGGYAEQLLDEMIFFAQKAEEKIAKEQAKVLEERKTGYADGSRSCELK